MSPELVVAYTSLFVQCWEQYAVQQGDGSYWRVAEPLSLPLVAAHLAGRWTLGTYLLDGQSCCSFAVFDADRVDGLERLAELAGELFQQGVPPCWKRVGVGGICGCMWWSQLLHREYGRGSCRMRQRVVRNCTPNKTGLPLVGRDR
jgi:hypothetical protein